VRQSYNVLGIAFDRWRFEDLGKLLSDEGIDLPMVEFIPGFKSYAPAVDAFERAVLDKRMQHNSNPLMCWQAGNVIIETDPAGNRKPTKSKSLDRIDGVITAIMACGLAERDEGPKVYQGTGAAWV
jgi:phage terminase large subunit-like protein